MLSLLPRLGAARAGHERLGGRAGEVEAALGGEVSPLRSYLVQQILEANPSATVEFLSRFDEESLRSYLDHLTAAAGRRGRQSRWVRPAGSRGIAWSETRV